MRPRSMAVAAALLLAVATSAVIITLRAGRSAEQVERAIGAGAAQPSATGDAPKGAESPTSMTGTPATTADPAPDFEGIAHWHNSPALTLSGLRGKVVLVDFWTYSCINCRRTLPEIRALHQRYAAAGLVVVGVHTPEFDFEKSHANVTKAVRDLDVTWPVAEDSERTTWAAYGNEYWPTVYLVDRAGRLRSQHIGEGQEGRIEDAVRRLLAEGGAPGEAMATSPTPTERPPAAGQRVTPELYLGTARGQGMVAGPGPVDTDQRVRRADRPGDRGTVSLTGVFLGGEEWVQAEPGARLSVTFRSRDVYLTAAPVDAPTSTATGAEAAAESARIDVTLEGKPVPPARRGRNIVVRPDGTTSVAIDSDDLAHLISGQAVADGALVLIVRTKAVRLYTLTFGG